MDSLIVDDHSPLPLLCYLLHGRPDETTQILTDLTERANRDPSDSGKRPKPLLNWAWTLFLSRADSGVQLACLRHILIMDLTASCFNTCTRATRTTSGSGAVTLLRLGQEVLRDADRLHITDCSGILGAAVLVLRERFAKLDDEVRDDAILRGLRQESVDLRLSELLC